MAKAPYVDDKMAAPSIATVLFLRKSQSSNFGDWQKKCCITVPNSNSGMYRLPSREGGVMLLAADSTIYLTFEDIARHAVLKDHWARPSGAVAGLIFGLVSFILIA